MSDKEEGARNLHTSAICRICGHNDRREILLRPCKCDGSIRLVHPSCLDRWLKQSAQNRRGPLAMNKCTSCEVCLYEFQYKPVYAEDTPKSLNVQELVTGFVDFILLEDKLHCVKALLSWLVWGFITPLGCCTILGVVWVGKTSVVYRNFGFRLSLLLGALIAGGGAATMAFGRKCFRLFRPLASSLSRRNGARMRVLNEQRQCRLNREVNEEGGISRTAAPSCSNSESVGSHLGGSGATLTSQGDFCFCLRVFGIFWKVLGTVAVSFALFLLYTGAFLSFLFRILRTLVTRILNYRLWRRRTLVTVGTQTDDNNNLNVNERVDHILRSLSTSITQCETRITEILGDTGPPPPSRLLLHDELDWFAQHTTTHATASSSSRSSLSSTLSSITQDVEDENNSVDQTRTSLRETAMSFTQADVAPPPQTSVSSPELSKQTDVESLEEPPLLSDPIANTQEVGQQIIKHYRDKKNRSRSRHKIRQVAFRSLQCHFIRLWTCTLVVWLSSLIFIYLFIGVPHFIGTSTTETALSKVISIQTNPDDPGTCVQHNAMFNDEDSCSINTNFESVDKYLPDGITINLVDLLSSGEELNTSSSAKMHVLTSKCFPIQRERSRIRRNHITHSFFMNFWNFWQEMTMPNKSLPHLDRAGVKTQQWHLYTNLFQAVPTLQSIVEGAHMSVQYTSETDGQKANIIGYGEEASMLDVDLLLIGIGYYRIVLVLPTILWTSLGIFWLFVIVSSLNASKWIFESGYFIESENRIQKWPALLGILHFVSDVFYLLLSALKIMFCSCVQTVLFGSLIPLTIGMVVGYSFIWSCFGATALTQWVNYLDSNLCVSIFILINIGQIYMSNKSIVVAYVLGWLSPGTVDSLILCPVGIWVFSYHFLVFSRFVDLDVLGVLDVINSETHSVEDVHRFIHYELPQRRRLYAAAIPFQLCASNSNIALERGEEESQQRTYECATVPDESTLHLYRRMNGISSSYFHSLSLPLLTQSFMYFLFLEGAIAFVVFSIIGRSIGILLPIIGERKFMLAAYTSRESRLSTPLLSVLESILLVVSDVFGLGFRYVDPSPHAPSAAYSTVSVGAVLLMLFTAVIWSSVYSRTAWMNKIVGGLCYRCGLGEFMKTPYRRRFAQQFEKSFNEQKSREDSVHHQHQPVTRLEVKQEDSRRILSANEENLLRLEEARSSTSSSSSSSSLHLSSGDTYSQTLLRELNVCASSYLRRRFKQIVVADEFLIFEGYRLLQKSVVVPNSLRRVDFVGTEIKRLSIESPRRPEDPRKYMVVEYDYSNVAYSKSIEPSSIKEHSAEEEDAYDIRVSKEICTIGNFILIDNSHQMRSEASTTSQNRPRRPADFASADSRYSHTLENHMRVCSLRDPQVNYELLSVIGRNGVISTELANLQVTVKDGDGRARSIVHSILLEPIGDNCKIYNLRVTVLAPFVQSSISGSCINSQLDQANDVWKAVPADLFVQPRNSQMITALQNKIRSSHATDITLIVKVFVFVASLTALSCCPWIIAVVLPLSGYDSIKLLNVRLLTCLGNLVFHSSVQYNINQIDQFNLVHKFAFGTVWVLVPGATVYLLYCAGKAVLRNKSQLPTRNLKIYVWASAVLLAAYFVLPLCVGAWLCGTVVDPLILDPLVSILTTHQQVEGYETGVRTISPQYLKWFCVGSFFCNVWMFALRQLNYSIWVSPFLFVGSSQIDSTSTQTVYRWYSRRGFLSVEFLGTMWEQFVKPMAADIGVTIAFPFLVSWFVIPALYEILPVKAIFLLGLGLQQYFILKFWVLRVIVSVLRDYKSVVATVHENVKNKIYLLRYVLVDYNTNDKSNVPIMNAP